MHIVVREGFYRHQIRGLWEDESKAIEEATRIISLERDDYHSYLVIFFPPNTDSIEKVVAKVTRKDFAPRTRPPTIAEIKVIRSTP